MEESESRAWLKTLCDGDIVTIQWRDTKEDVFVEKKANPKREVVSVRVKRKHLKQRVWLREAGPWVSCRFSNWQGNEHLDFKNWSIQRKNLET
jgi:hypothetical protein